MPLVAAPQFDWATGPGSANAGDYVCATAQFTTTLSDNSDGNDWNCCGSRMYRITLYVTKPDGSVIVPCDWLPGGPLGDCCQQTTQQQTGCWTCDQVGTYSYYFSCMDARPWYGDSPTYSFYAAQPWSYVSVPNPTGLRRDGTDIRNYYEHRHSNTGKRADVGIRYGGTDISNYFQPGANGYDSGFRSGGSSLGSLFA